MKKEKKIDSNEKQELELKIKKQIDSHNKLLKKIFIAAGILIIIFLLVYLFIISQNHIKYKGVDFYREKYCDSGPCIVVYKTSIPVRYTDEKTGKIVDADYNIYLRNNPKEIGEVPIKGDVIFRKNMVLGVNTENLFCEGDWVIAIANLQKVNTLGINIIARNESELKIYVPAEDYMYVNIKEANETSIEQIKENSYNLNVNNCEILKATERFMLEAFIQAHKK